MQFLSKALTFSGLTLAAFVVPSLPAKMVAEPVMATEAGRAATVQLAQFQDARPRITVLTLDHGDISADYWWWRNYYRGQGAVKGITELLVNELVNDGSYSLLDSSQFKAEDGSTVSEQKILESSEGQDLDAVLMGSITQFDLKQRNDCINVPFRGRVCRNQTKATVRLNVRLVDPVSKTVIATAQGKGEKASSNFGVNLAGRVPDLNSSEQRAVDELLSEATEQAIQQLVPEISKAQTKFELDFELKKTLRLIF